MHEIRINLELYLIEESLDLIRINLHAHSDNLQCCFISVMILKLLCIVVSYDFRR